MGLEQKQKFLLRHLQYIESDETLTSNSNILEMWLIYSLLS